MHLEIETFDSGVFVKYNNAEYFLTTLTDFNPLRWCYRWKCTCGFTLGTMGLQLVRAFV